MRKIYYINQGFECMKKGWSLFAYIKTMVTFWLVRLLKQGYD